MGYSSTSARITIKDESNTYFLETNLGWSGLAVDAIPEFGPDYATFRPRTTFVAMFATIEAETR